MRDEILLKQILESVFKIESYVENVDYSKFEKTSEKQDAVVKRLETVGEGVKRLSMDSEKTILKFNGGRSPVSGKRLFTITWELISEQSGK